jgi:hypothetical protein
VKEKIRSKEQKKWILIVKTKSANATKLNKYRERTGRVKHLICKRHKCKQSKKES